MFVQWYGFHLRLQLGLQFVCTVVFIAVGTAFSTAKMLSRFRTAVIGRWYLLQLGLRLELQFILLRFRIAVCLYWFILVWTAFSTAVILMAFYDCSVFVR